MAEARAITCPHCNAPLRLRGGGRVLTVTCHYCHSIIDLNKHYRILGRFKNIQRPDTPFSIGMEGELFGVHYTIIGMVAHELPDFSGETWVDFLLFSPLYGYAWISYEEGYTSFSRRTRHFPALEWNTLGTIKKEIEVEERRYTYAEYYSSKITYVEGELTWLAKKGYKTEYKSFLAPPYGISIEKTKQELEWYKEEYIPAETLYDAFDIPPEARVEGKGIYPLKPFNIPLWGDFYREIGYMIAFVLLLISFMMFDGGGTKILDFKVTDQTVAQQKFTITDTSYLTSISIMDITPSKTETNQSNLDHFQFRITHQDRVIFTLDAMHGALYGDDTRNVATRILTSWKSRAKDIIVYLKLKKKGTYTLLVKPIGTQNNTILRIIVRESVYRLLYFFYLMAASLLLIALYALFKRIHHYQVFDGTFSIWELFWQKLSYYLFFSFFFAFIGYMYWSAYNG